MSYWQNFLTSHLAYKPGDGQPSGVRVRPGKGGTPVLEVGSLTPESCDEPMADRITGPDFSKLLER